MAVNCVPWAAVVLCGAADMLQRPPPGLSVLLSLMGGRQLEKALLHHVLGPGYADTEVRVSARKQQHSCSAAWCCVVFCNVYVPGTAGQPGGFLHCIPFGQHIVSPDPTIVSRPDA